MNWFCSDVPEHLIISTLNLGRHVSKGNQGQNNQRMPWTVELEDLADQMREEGNTWTAIAAELADRTGILLSPKTVEDRIQRRRGE